jgi:hypothetical protein
VPTTRMSGVRSRIWMRKSRATGESSTTKTLIKLYLFWNALQESAVAERGCRQISRLTTSSKLF